jgi:pyruvate dehydrogenase E2 component (dihydrolipoamide acetyltransferase)
MSKEFKLQDPGEGIHEAEIREVLVSVGDDVEENQDVFVVETDKAAVEISSPYAGKVKSIEFEPGDVAEVGDVLMTFDGTHGSDDTGDGDQPSDDQAASDDEEESNADPHERENDNGDVDESVAAGKDEADTNGKKKSKKRVLATPATRKLARDLDVDLREISGSGPDGRVTDDDVRSRAERSNATKASEDVEPKERKSRGPSETKSRSEASSEVPDFSKWGDVEREPLRSVRRVMARRMATSWREIPHVTHHDVADVTQIEAFRRTHEDADDLEGKLTLTAILLKAAVAALRQFPRINASLDTDAGELILKCYYHIGVAVDTERGLMVPVVRNVDRKSLAELTGDLESLAQRARDGKATKDDLSGASFTVTNIGPLGGTGFSPIIDHPQVAILGAAQARMQPVVDGSRDDYRIEPRLMLPLCLAFDHRVVDGAEAARFMNAVMGALSDPDHLALVA